jgi:hypothetical protein
MLQYVLDEHRPFHRRCAPAILSEINRPPELPP